MVVSEYAWITTQCNANVAVKVKINVPDSHQRSLPSSNWRSQSIVLVTSPTNSIPLDLIPRPLITLRNLTLSLYSLKYIFYNSFCIINLLCMKRKYLLYCTCFYLNVDEMCLVS